MADNQHANQHHETEETTDGTAENAEVVGFAGFIKFDGVDAESLDADHKGWSDLQSFGQAVFRVAPTATFRP